jgi:putative transposase
VEDLNMKNMSQYLNFGKSVMDNGWGMFIEFLSYKVKKLIKIDKWFPSSKTCHVCGYKNDNLTLSDRDWTCPDCGTHHDRDINASINILNQGLLLV